MAIPAITRDQVLMLAFLADGELSGRCLREKFAGEGVRRSGPAFYQLTARMEGEGLIAGRYGRCRVGGRPFRERLYRATEVGLSRWGEFSDFVLAHARSDRPEAPPRAGAGPLRDESKGPAARQPAGRPRKKSRPGRAGGPAETAPARLHGETAAREPKGGERMG